MSPGPCLGSCGSEVYCFVQDLSDCWPIPVPTLTEVCQVCPVHNSPCHAPALCPLWLRPALATYQASGGDGKNCVRRWCVRTLAQHVPKEGIGVRWRGLRTCGACQCWFPWMPGHGCWGLAHQGAWADFSLFLFGLMLHYLSLNPYEMCQPVLALRVLVAQSAPQMHCSCDVCLPAAAQQLLFVPCAMTHEHVRYASPCCSNRLVCVHRGAWASCPFIAHPGAEPPGPLRVLVGGALWRAVCAACMLCVCTYAACMRGGGELNGGMCVCLGY